MTRTQRMSFDAGYRAGYTGRPPRPELRSEELQPIYLAGFYDGKADYEKHLHDIVTRPEREDSDE